MTNEEIFEAKGKIDRYALKRNILSKVLIRVDYDGVTNIGNWIDMFASDKELSEPFNIMEKGEQNQVTFDLSRTKEIAQQRSIPLKTFRSELITKFSDSHFKDRSDIVVMEISSLYMTFLVECREYKNLDVYIDYICKYFNKFLEGNRFYRIKRIGIRKIGGSRFATLQDVNSIFEPNLFACNVLGLEGTYLLDKSYTDRFRHNNVKVNFTRCCRNTGREDAPYEAVLDLDGYVDMSTIPNYGSQFPHNLKEVLTEINDYLFHLFKMAVTIKHLEDYANR